MISISHGKSYPLKRSKGYRGQDNRLFLTLLFERDDLSHRSHSLVILTNFTDATLSFVFLLKFYIMENFPLLSDF